MFMVIAHTHHCHALVNFKFLLLSFLYDLTDKIVNVQLFLLLLSAVFRNAIKAVWSFIKGD
jgi:hypothetical protein